MSAAAFRQALTRFEVTVASRRREVLVGMVTGLKASIVEGSALTGAPGQPVDIGYLRNSWQEVIAPDFQSAVIGTPAAYAPVFEFNSRAMYNAAGRTGEDDPQFASAASRNRAFGERGGQVGPSEGGDRVTLRSAVGGFGSVRLTVANADAIQRDVVGRVTGGQP